METTTFNHTITANYTHRVSKPAFFSAFINWCKNQQENRLLWLGVALTGHGCIITPITIMAILLAGNSLPLFIVALTAMGMALVTNLAALPTKITIPVFIFSILIDLGIIISCAVIGFNPGYTF